jgi:hypothetical protein
LSREFSAKFRQTVLAFFDEQRIVSAVARLHPLFPQQSDWLNDWGEVAPVNQTVAIDLTLSESEQKQQYAHSLKNDINRLKKRNLLIKQAQTKTEIDDFTAIYWENMQRVQASKDYFFPKTYFYRFLETLPASLLVAYDQNEMISGVLYSECNSIIQAHLSATKNNALALSPVKALWDCIRQYGTETQQCYFHLGGGAHGQNDNLFAFKAQFSKQYFWFRIWKYIHNPPIYEELVSRTFQGKMPSTNYFPLYRA